MGRVAIIFALLFPSSALPDSMGVPVPVGGDKDLDACGLIGSVQGLRPTPGNALNVRSGPSLSYLVIGQLPEGTEFVHCALSDNEEWLGIVIPDDKESDCGLGQPIEQHGIYTGDCLSGWVHRSFTTLK